MPNLEAIEAILNQGVVNDFLTLADGRQVAVDVYGPRRGVEPKAMIVGGHGATLYGSVNPDGVSEAPAWQALAERGFVVVVPTLPGHAHSDGRRGDWKLTDYALCSQAVLDWTLDYRQKHRLPVYYVGWSQGGLGGMVVADRCGGQFNGYFLHGAGIPGDPELREYTRYAGPGFWRRLLYAAQELLIIDGLALVAPRLRWPVGTYLPLKKIWGGKAGVRRWKRDKLAVRRYTLRAIRSLVRTPLLSDPEFIVAPIGLLWLDRDTGSREYLHRLASQFANASVIEASGDHTMPRTAPDALAALVEQFIKEAKIMSTTPRSEHRPRGLFVIGPLADA